MSNINFETMQHKETRPINSPILYTKTGYEATVRLSTLLKFKVEDFEGSVKLVYNQTPGSNTFKLLSLLVTCSTYLANISTPVVEVCHHLYLQVGNGLLLTGIHGTLVFTHYEPTTCIF